MCNRRIEMRKIKKVLEYTYNENLSQHKIANIMHISRGAVRDYQRRFKAIGISWKDGSELSNTELESLLFPKRPSNNKPHPDWSYIHKEMKRKGATIAVLYEEYFAENPSGISYSHFFNEYKKYRKKLPASIRLVHHAGEKIMVDYAGHTVKVVDQETGEIRKAQIFVGILPCSGYTYAEATWDQKKVSWISSHVRMFNYFGGVARYLIPDNLKSAVTKAGWNNLVLNRTYEDMAEHYGIIVEPARPGQPKDKALGENAVKIVERRILFCLRNHTFFGLNELNQKILELVEKINAKETKRIPLGRTKFFETLEKHELKPLPEKPYQYAEFKTQLVRPDYTINIDEHAYSVPYQFIQQKVEVKVTENTIEIFHNQNRIASHPKSSVQGGCTMNQLHMPENHKKIKEWLPERLLDVASFAGDEVLKFIQHLEPTQMTEIGRYKAGTRLQKLLDEHGDEKLNKACRYARESKAFSLDQVQNIIKNKYNQLTDAIQINDGVSEHENIRGSNYYH